MGLEDKFNAIFAQWIRHCQQGHVQIDSSADSVIGCEPYQQIVDMGRSALPFIRKAYDHESDFYFKVSGQNAEILCAPTKNLARNRSFMEALMAFQYGTAEESANGFEQMENIMCGENPALESIKYHGLYLAVLTIVGAEFSIPEEFKGNMMDVAEYTKSWLDKK